MSALSDSAEDRTMTTSHSVTRGLQQLKQGDRQAVGPLWERYFTRLVHLARSWFPRPPTTAAAGRRPSVRRLGAGAGRRRAGALFMNILGHEPEPALVVQATEECRRLLAELGDKQLRQVAQWKVEGFTNEEIAAKLGRALSTVERKLGRIRRLWRRS